MTVKFDDDLFGSTKVESKSGDFDDLFSEPPMKPKPPPSTAAKQKTPPTDDLSAAASTTRKTTSNKDDLITSDTKPRTGSKEPNINIFDSPPEDIFGTTTKGKKADTDDMFGSSTSDMFSSGGRKSKGLDDLFATDVPKASKGKGVKREAVKDDVGRGEGKREEAGKKDSDIPQTGVPKAKAKEVSKEEVDSPQPQKVSENLVSFPDSQFSGVATTFAIMCLQIIVGWWSTCRAVV